MIWALGVKLQLSPNTTQAVDVYVLLLIADKLFLVNSAGALTTELVPMKAGWTPVVMNETILSVQLPSLGKVTGTWGVVVTASGANPLDIAAWKAFDATSFTTE